MIPAAVEAWMTRHIASDEVEAAMRRAGDERGFPIIGPLVGQTCLVLAKSIGAKKVFEMGSGFGYSTLWFARAVGDGEVVHTDGDPARTKEAKEWLRQAGLEQRVRFVTDDAIAALKREQGPFDVVFIDIDKGDYPQAWEVAKQKVRVGGLILTDNTLWSGKVADEAVRDDWTEAVRAYVAKAHADPDFETFIDPVRDGLCVSLRLR